MSTLGQLKTDVDAWLARDDVAVSGSSFPSILLLAEAEIARDIRTLVQEQRTTLTANSRYTDMPSDFMEIRQIFIDDNNGRRFMEYQTPEVLRENNTWLNGRSPSFYSLEGDEDTGGIGDVRLVLAPEPSASSPSDVEVLYWARFPALVNDPDTNWLLQNYYDVYLWQTLKQAAIFIQESELADTYDTNYQAARENTSRAENRKRYAAGGKQAYGNPRAII